MIAVVAGEAHNLEVAGSNPAVATQQRLQKQKRMKKIVIFKRDENGNKVVLRSISPTEAWQGYSSSGNIIDSEAKNLIKVLEPTCNGYYLA